MPSSLNSTFDTKIQVRLQVEPARLQAHLPDPWRVGPTTEGPHRGANFLVIFTDVLLRQDGDGAAAPDAVNRYVAFLAPAVHPVTGERAQFMLRVLAAHPASVPGRFGNSIAAAVRREQTITGTGFKSVCTERFQLHAAEDIVDLELRYHRGTPERAAWPTHMRSARDPAIARFYRSEALLDVVQSIPAHIQRVQDYALRITVAEFANLLDGTERLVSITSVPWFTRQEFASAPDLSL